MKAEDMKIGMRVECVKVCVNTGKVLTVTSFDDQRQCFYCEEDYEKHSPAYFEPLDKPKSPMYYVGVTHNVTKCAYEYNNKKYLFISHIKVKPSDIVCVSTKYGLTLGTVKDITTEVPETDISKLEEVICVIDTTEYDQRKAKKGRIKQLKSEMDKKVKVLQTNALYELLSEKDDSLREMLSEYNELTKE